MTDNQQELFGQPEDDGLLQQVMQEEQEAQDEPELTRESFDTAIQASDADSIADFLQEQCMTVEMELGSLPTSFAIPKEVKQKWAETTKTDSVVSVVRWLF